MREQTAKLEDERDRVAQLQILIDARGVDADGPKSSPRGSLKELQPHDPRRDSAASGSSKLSKRSTDLNTEDNLKDQVKGLKYVSSAILENNLGSFLECRHINMELRKENSGLLSQIKVLESECKMQSSELDELRKVGVRSRRLELVG